MTAPARTSTSPGELVPLLTFEAVAGIFDVSVSTVRRWARSGVLVPVRLTRRTVRFRARDVARLIDERAGGPARWTS